MARNPYSGEGTDLGIAFIRTTPGSGRVHHVRGDYAALAFFGFIGRHGIVPGDRNELACTVNASRVVGIDTGSAWMNQGEYPILVGNGSVKTRTLDAVGSLARVDAIVLRYTAATNTVDFAVVKGNEGGGRASTVANLSTNDLVLAYVTVPATGDPSVAYDANRFFQVTAPATETGAAALTAAGLQRTLQAPASGAGQDINRSVLFNDRGLTRNATNMWALAASSTFQIYEDFGYGFSNVTNVGGDYNVSGSVQFFFDYWDAANGNWWLVAVLLDGSNNLRAAGRIIESTTASRVTSGYAPLPFPNPGGAIPANTVVSPTTAYGVQVGDDVVIVCGGTNSRVAMFSVSVGGRQANSLSLVVGNALVSHASNANWSVQLAAPGADGTVLAAFNSAADLDFHDSDDNGDIERWNAMGVKQSGSAPLARGNLLGKAFNYATAPGSIATLTRIEDILCFASREMIVPVQDASDLVDFWAFVGVGQ